LITIACPCIGRWYAVDAFLSGFEGLEYDKKNINIIFIDNSGDKKFQSHLRKWIKQNKKNWANVSLVIHESEIIEITDESEASEEPHLMSRWATLVARTADEARQEILKTDCEYGWIIEDDIVIPYDACNKHLRMFDMADNVGATVGYAIQRHNSMIIDRKALAWDFNRKRVFPEGDTDEETIELSISTPPPDKWIEVIDSSTFSSVMIKREVLEKIKFVGSYKGISMHDCIFGLQLQDNGYVQMMDWSLKVKHLHTTGDVLL